MPSYHDDDADEHPCVMRNRISAVEEQFGLAIQRMADIQTQIGHLDVDPEKSTGLVGMVVRLSNQMTVWSHDSARSQFEGESTKVQTRAELYERLRRYEDSDRQRSTPPEGAKVAIAADRKTIISIVAVIVAAATGAGAATWLEALK